jgi:hypothetical protein
VLCFIWGTHWILKHYLSDCWFTGFSAWLIEYHYVTKQVLSTVVLCGLVVSELSIGPTIRGFRPGRVWWVLRAIKIRSTTSFGGEVKPSVPYCKILWYFKEPFEVWKRYFVRKKVIISFANSYCFATRWLLIRLPESSGWRIRSFPSRSHSTVVLHVHVSPGEWTIGLLVAAVQRQSHPTDMIIITKHLISQIRDLLEKLTVVQVMKHYPACYGTKCYLLCWRFRDWPLLWSKLKGQSSST